MTPTSIGGEKQACISGGVNPSADIASGILELISEYCFFNSLIVCISKIKQWNYRQHCYPLKGVVKYAFAFSMPEVWQVLLSK